MQTTINYVKSFCRVVVIFIFGFFAVSSLLYFSIYSFMGFILAVLAMILCLPQFNKLTKKFNYSIPTRIKIVILLVLFVFVLMFFVGSEMSSSDVSSTAEPIKITKPSINYAKDCFDKYVTNYKQRSSFPKAFPSYTIMCLSSAAQINNDSTICDQLNTLPASQILQILLDPAVSSEYGAEYQTCTVIAGLGDGQSANECKNDARIRFVTNKINLCKQEMRIVKN
ncbi:MAG TPA: hypothetical protein HA224_05005 [Nanoarchaeota archaeon]|nr:hypothetical protein [Nanoarchaeota archaeon]